jgi:hypothetical protein
MPLPTADALGRSWRHCAVRRPIQGTGGCSLRLSLWAESLRRHSPTDRALTVAGGGKAVPMLLGFKHARCDQLLLLDLG